MILWCFFLGIAQDVLELCFTEYCLLTAVLLLYCAVVLDAGCDLAELSHIFYAAYFVFFGLVFARMEFMGFVHYSGILP